MPAWSSDGLFLYSRTSNGTIQRIDAKSGEEKVIYSPPPDESGIRNLSMSPDGSRLAFFANSRAMKAGGEWTATTHRWIHVLDLSGGSIRSIEISGSGAYGGNTMAWSPDGRYIVFVSGGGKSTIWIAPSDGTAPPRSLFKALDGNALHLAFAPDGKTLTYTLSVRQRDMWTMSNFLGGGQ
ncbi:MAG: PD40 domain-containing protein [Acidobacteria bacterium]|nr:PD40 domain-containing protein [Acidobacteriota bacterium]